MTDARSIKKVSVIIPVYNEERYIAACLGSLVNQSFPAHEIIVVDDGSSDSSLAEIEKASKSTKIKIFKQKHQGPSAARNLGAKRADGDIFVFIDADLKLDKNYLKNLLKPILKGKAKATFTRDELVGNPKNVWSKCWSINSYLPYERRIPEKEPSRSKNFRAIRRDVFIKTSGYAKVGYGEDSSVLSQVKNVYAEAAPGALCYHFNPESLGEVFVSARWFGRGETVRRNFHDFLIFSLPNSIRRGAIDALRHNLPAFVVFKLVFDFGVTLGMIERRFMGIYSK